MLLRKIDFDVTSLDDYKNLPDNDKEKLFTSYSVLAKTKEDLGSLRELLFGKSRK